MRTTLFLAVLLALNSGCMTERLPPPASHPSIAGQTTYLIQKVRYDDHGRPLFTERVGRRPRASGATFTVVQAIDGLPSRSYDIAVVEQPRNEPGPLAVIYTWTGKGYEGGLEITAGIVPEGTVGSGAEAAAYLAVKAAPVVIATATGFVVGVLASIPATARELKRVIIGTREVATGYRTYAFDDQRRIRFMKLYPPNEHAEALVRTEYFYEGDGDVPVRTEVTSVPEDRVRKVP